ncbi:MAG: LON peptidase substrate-binding domain-containing protein, partial [Clostridia bacterium]
MRKLQTVHLPVLPLRGLMLFPNMVLHFDVGRQKSVMALERGMTDRQRVFLVSQKDESVEEPTWNDLCKVGTVAEIRQVMNLPGENIRVLVEGKCRGVIEEAAGDDPCMSAVIRLCEDKVPRSAEAKALMRTCQDLFAEYARSSQRVSQETVDSMRTVEKAGEAADLLAANVLTKMEERQDILNELDPLKRLEKMCAILIRETDMADT